MFENDFAEAETGFAVHGIFGKVFLEDVEGPYVPTECVSSFVLFFNYSWIVRKQLTCSRVNVPKVWSLGRVILKEFTVDSNTKVRHIHSAMSRSDSYY